MYKLEVLLTHTIEITCRHNSGASIGYIVSVYPYDGLTPVVAALVATRSNHMLMRHLKSSDSLSGTSSDSIYVTHRT